VEVLTVDKLYDQLQHGFHGCSLEKHEHKLDEHMNTVNNHHGLNDIFNDTEFPSVLNQPDIMSAKKFSEQVHPTPEQWKSMFCGISSDQSQPGTSPDQSEPMNVCLHQEETQEVQAQLAFDIDSFLGFASTLAVTRKGLRYQPTPQMRQNITTDVHVESEVFNPLPHLAMLKEIPHFFLGRVEGAPNVTVHILFPHLVSKGPFVSLTEEQLACWLNQIFHPAVHKYYGAHYTQHLPASFKHGLAESKANQVEGRKVVTASYQAQQALGYHLQPEQLDLVWSDILHTINQTPGLNGFRDPQIFFSAKGTKLQFKSNSTYPTLLDCMERFQSYLEDLMDLDFIFLDRFYVDIGKEICPNVSLLPGQPEDMSEAQVYSWKRCCLEEYLNWMYDGKPPRSGQKFYDQNMLRDACCLTSVTPKKSKHRDGGLIYSQFYASVKEVIDAAKCKPFENDGLEELSLDPEIRKGARNVIRGQWRDIKVLEKAYCASKQRSMYALQDSVGKSFGIREEHRVSWSLFQSLVRKLCVGDQDVEMEGQDVEMEGQDVEMEGQDVEMEGQDVEMEDVEDQDVEMEDMEEEDMEDQGQDTMVLNCPSYVWAIQTKVYLNYLWRSADKFATGFELIHAKNQKLVTWEQTKMMAMFLGCLRSVFCAHQLSRESALWWSKKERVVGDPPRKKIWYGLGFCNTLPRYGLTFSWLTQY
jgi:hypothetical protein